MTRQRSNTKEGLLNRQLAFIKNILIRNGEQTALVVTPVKAGRSIAKKSNNSVAETNYSEKCSANMANSVHPASKLLAAMPNSRRTEFGPSDENGPKRMLAELNRTRQLPEAPFFCPDAGSNNAKAMSAKVDDQVSTSVARNNLNLELKAMLADVRQHAQLYPRKVAEDDDDDLEVLRSRLTAMLLHRRHVEANTDSETELDMPNAMTPKSENADFASDKVQHQATHPYSSDPKDDVAQQEKDTMPMDELLAIFQKRDEEAMAQYQAFEKEMEEELLSRRLIVSNLAADADEDDLREFITQHGFRIRDMVFLNERHPTKRTRAAYVDMWSRLSAVRTSFIYGSIFGLTVKFKLAVERTD